MKRKKGLLAAVCIVILGSALLSVCFSSIPIHQYHWGMETANRANSSWYLLTTATSLVCQTYTAQMNGTAVYVSVYLGLAGVAPFMRIGLQGANAMCDPDGVYISSVDFQINAAKVWTFRIPDVAISNGTVYAIVISYVNGTINSSNCIYPYYTLGTASKFYFNTTEYTDHDASFKNSGNSGSSWTGSLCIWSSSYVELSSGEIFGCVYQTSAAGLIMGTYVSGEKFAVPYNMTVSGLQVQANVYDGTIRSDLNVFLYDHTTDQYIINNQTYAHWEEGVDYSTGSQIKSWLGCFLDPTLDLIAGHLYYLWFSCRETAGTARWYVWNSRTIDVATAAYSWGNTTFCAISANTDIIPNTEQTDQDLQFRFTVLTEDAAAPGAGGDLTEPGDLALLIVIGLICVPVGIILLAVVFRRRH